MANKILDKINKKTLTLIIALIVVIVILLVFVIIKIVSKSDKNDKNISSSQNSYSDQSGENNSNINTFDDESIEESSSSTSEDNSSGRTNASKDITRKDPLTSNSSKATVVVTPSNPVTSTSPTAVEIINKTNQNIQNIQNLKNGLSLKSEITNPAILNISVPDKYDLDKAANFIIDKIKKELCYDEINNKSDPHVFDYEYKITDNGKTGSNNNFKLVYKLKMQHYKTTICDSDKIVETVINKMSKSGFQHVEYLPNQMKLESIPISFAILNYDLDTATNTIRDNLIMDIQSLEEQNQKSYKQFDFIYYSEYENQQGEKGLMFQLFVK